MMGLRSQRRRGAEIFDSRGDAETRRGMDSGRRPLITATVVIGERLRRRTISASPRLRVHNFFHSVPLRLCESHT